ncbi:MAG TPA: hypothetical protein PLD88_13085, partial [Candidatus Berkiella sp.]|nr:hypothetical protein [Candidatus Berkiella sp.]
MKKHCYLTRIVAWISALLLISQNGFAADADLAKQLTNPIANLINFPLQYNFNDHMNPQSSGQQSYVNVQPVVPISISCDWMMISRTILPVIDATNPLPYTGERFGLNDTLQSLFFSPKKPTNGIIWGVGPALQLPTGTQELLGTGKWAAGPTIVILKMTDTGWTIGALTNHLWSLAGSSGRDSLNQTFLQPFIAYTTKTAWTYTLNSESTYYWNQGDISLPI